MLDASNAGYIDLAHALRAGWIEFWYQPKIDLRDRQIVGVEMFARARHPFHGPISAAVILQDASDTLLMQLAVFSLRWALQASAAMAQEGVRLPITLNMPAAAIDPTAIADLLAQGPQGKEWRGLIFDVPKHDILADYQRLERSGARLASLGIRLAADSSTLPDGTFALPGWVSPTTRCECGASSLARSVTVSRPTMAPSG